MIYSWFLNCATILNIAELPFLLPLENRPNFCGTIKSLQTFKSSDFKDQRWSFNRSLCFSPPSPSPRACGQRGGAAGPLTSAAGSERVLAREETPGLCSLLVNAFSTLSFLPPSPSLVGFFSCNLFFSCFWRHSFLPLSG